MRITFPTSLITLACTLSALITLTTSAPQSTTTSSDSTEINLSSPWMPLNQLNVTPIDDPIYALSAAQCTPQLFPAVPNPECITKGMSAFTTYFTNVTGPYKYGENYNNTILYINIRGTGTNVLIYWKQSDYIGHTFPLAPYNVETLAINTIHYLQSSQYSVACVELVQLKVTVLLTYVENVRLINPWNPNPPPAIVQGPIQVAEIDDPLVGYFNTCK